MAKAGEITIDVNADFAKFSSAMTKASQETATAVGGINQSLGSISQGIDLLKTAAGAFGISLGVGAFVGFIKESLDAAAAINDLSQQIGVTAEDLQVLQFAARQNGADTAQLTGGVEHLTRSIGQAAAGSKTAIDSFNSLGVKLLDVHGNVRSTDEVLIEIARHIAQAKTPADQARIAFEAFGKGGQALIPTLTQIGEHFDETRQKAHDMGQVFDAEATKASNDLKNSWDELVISLETTAAHLVAGPLKTFFDWFNAQINAARANAERGPVVSATPVPGQSWWDWLIPHDFTYDPTGAGSYGGRRTPMSVPPGDQGVTAGVYQPAATGGGKTVESEAEKQAAAIAKVVAQLQFENEQIGMSSEAQKINSALRQAGVEITSAAGQQIAAEVHIGAERTKQLADENKLEQEAKTVKEAIQTPQEKYNDLLDEYNQLLAAGLITSKQHDAAVAAAAKAVEDADPAYKAAIAEQKELQNAIEDAAGSLLNDLGRAFTDSGTAADRWKNLVSHAIQDVMSVFESLAKKMLGAGLDSLFGGVGASTLGSIFGFGGSAVLGPLAGSPMVLGGGGSMGTGDWAIVGERGPELVYADTPGNVMSADRTRGIFGSGGGSDQGGNVAYIDARGADMGAVARIEAGLQKLNYSIEHRAVAAVQNERRRGGTFAGTFNR